MGGLTPVLVEFLEPVMRFFPLFLVSFRPGPVVIWERRLASIHGGGTLIDSPVSSPLRMTSESHSPRGSFGMLGEGGSGMGKQTLWVEEMGVVGKETSWGVGHTVTGAGDLPSRPPRTILVSAWANDRASASGPDLHTPIPNKASAKCAAADHAG